MTDFGLQAADLRPRFEKQALRGMHSITRRIVGLPARLQRSLSGAQARRGCFQLGLGLLDGYKLVFLIFPSIVFFQQPQGMLLLFTVFLQSPILRSHLGLGFELFQLTA